jgi:PAS domain S-box-containing protein
MADSREQLLRERDRLAKRLTRERSARAQAEEIAERAISDLSRINREYETFFNRSLSLYCTVDTTLRFRELNPTWERLLGWTLDELRARPLTDFVHPDDVEATRSEAKRLVEQSGTTEGFEIRFLHQEGHAVWLSWSVIFAKGIFYAEAREITDRKRAESALQASEARLRAILNSAVDAILTIDARGIIDNVNPATEKMFGYAAGEMEGKNVSLLMSAPHSAHHDGYIRRYLQSGVAKVIGTGRETLARRRDGRTFPIDLTVGELRLGERVLFTGIIRDISVRKAAQARLEETLQDLAKSRDDLLTTLNQLREGTLLIDAEGRLTFVSDNWNELTWAQAEDAIGKRWDEVLPLDRQGRSSMRTAMRQPTRDRARLRFSWLNARKQLRAVEIDIRDDPRDASARIVFVYDATEVQELRSQLAATTHGRMIGDCAPMRALYAEIAQVAQGDWTVLVEGETGVGKELVARAIHAASPRSEGPFVAVNCAGLTDTLLESQLFGHRKGAFTGALTDQRGLFEAAAGGTLLLDEIGDISMKLQSTLLRVIQEREILRVGDTEVRPVDVRIIAATHRDLQREAAAGRFRQDLLYRIRVARIAIPPLRERSDDIALLANSFLEEQRLRAGKPALQLDARALRALTAFSWPGNVRELRSAIEYAVIHCIGDAIGVGDLPPECAAEHPIPSSASPSAPIFDGATAARFRRPSDAEEPPPRSTEADPRSAILAALEWAEGNRARAARKLGISRATLYRRLAELGIPSKRSKR